MRLVVAEAEPTATRLADELRAEGAEVLAVTSPRAPASAARDATADRDAAELIAELSRVDVLVVSAERRCLTPELVALCDRFSVRIAPIATASSGIRLAESYGLTAFGPDVDAQDLLRGADPGNAVSDRDRGRIIAVWGAGGAPGRTTVAIEVAAELARCGRRVALVDADSHAPAVAMLTGLADEGPGFPAACRMASRGELSSAELARIAVPVGEVDVLTGLNRPSRWPELSAARVAAALESCRDWTEDIVVDVSAALERDEEIVSDVDGPRRNAATLAAIEAADVVVAVVAADPVGVSRFVRAFSDLRAAAGAAQLSVVVTKVRSGPLGLDPRGQVRQALERYCSVSRISFVPWDQRAADAAVLAQQPVAHTAPRSALASAIRRFVAVELQGQGAPDRVRERGARRTPWWAGRRTRESLVPEPAGA